MAIDINSDGKKNTLDRKLILIDRLTESFRLRAEENGFGFSCIIRISEYIKKTAENQFKADLTECFENALKKCIAERKNRIIMIIADETVVKIS